MKIVLMVTLMVLSATAAYAGELTPGLYVPDIDTCRFSVIETPKGMAIKRVKAYWTRVRNGYTYAYNCTINGAMITPNDDGTYSGKLRYSEGKYTHIVVYPLNSKQIIVEYRTPNSSITPDEFLKDMNSGDAPVHTIYRGTK